MMLRVHSLIYCMSAYYYLMTTKPWNIFIIVNQIKKNPAKDKRTADLNVDRSCYTQIGKLQKVGESATTNQLIRYTRSTNIL